MHSIVSDEAKLPNGTQTLDSETVSIPSTNDESFEESVPSTTEVSLPSESGTCLPFTDFVDMASAGREEAISGIGEEYLELQGLEEMVLLHLKTGDRKRLKLLLRASNWPANDLVRTSLWHRICRHLHNAKGSIYDEFEKDLFGSRKSNEIQLPSFVDFNYLTHYHLSSEGVQTVHKVLAVIHHTNPDIIYSPSLFSIVSLFLHYMGPSDCYDCVYGLLRSKDGYIPQTKVCVEASKLVLRDLTKKFAKSAYVHLVRNSSSVDSVFDTWGWWIFQELPFSYLVRVFDCYLYEGIKVLYRVALAILILYTKYSAKRSNAHHPVSASIVNNIRQFCRDMPVKVDKLLKTGFGIRGLSRKEIKKLQVKHEMYVNSRNLLSNDPLSKSASSQSVGLKLSKSFSGPIPITFQNVDTTVFTTEMLYTIWKWLPARYAVCQPELLYTSEEHGTSLMTLYARSEHREPTLIVVKTTKDEVFGAFCSSNWYDRKQSTKNLSYFGTGETFIFTLAPEVRKYDWVGLKRDNIPNTANMFLAGDNSVLTVGGGSGEALALDASLQHCRTERCDTFDNDPLASSEDFHCKVVEVFGFN